MAMILKIVNSISSFLFSKNLDENQEEEEGEEEILNKITNFSENSETNSSESEEDEDILDNGDSAVFNVESFKCFNKEGKITFLGRNYGIIDDVYLFENSQVEDGLIIRQNDEVIYAAIKVRENEADRVLRVLALKKDKENEITKEKKAEGEIFALTRCLTATVTNIEENKIYIEPYNIWYDLSKNNNSFKPISGDWVQLKATVSVEDRAPNLTGHILDIESVLPLVKREGSGRVTKWKETEKEGVIENKIYFDIFSCGDGYVPALEDEVKYYAIESDQDTYRWRAVKVVSLKNNEKNENTKNTSKNLDVYANKFGITITPAVVAVQVEYKKSKLVVLEISNKGPTEHYLRHVKMSSKSKLLILENPKPTDRFFMTPNYTMQYKFRCSGENIGLTGVTVFFYFKNFVIARPFEIQVIGSTEMNKVLDCRFNTVVEPYTRPPVKREILPELTFYGPKMWKRPKFVSTETNCVFKIPRTIWTIMNNEKLSKLKTLLDFAPCLKEDLNMKNYSERFHLLLYLEEINVKKKFLKFSMTNVHLTRKGDFLSLKVPGLGEGRPSLMMGDTIEITQPWLDEGKTKQVGTIFEVGAEEIYFKLFASFQNNYDGSACDVVFVPNTTFLSKCHEAVQRAPSVLGAECLFPSTAREKSALVDLEIPEDPHLEENCEDTETPNERPRKVLVWANKILNERQKLSIVNVLKGKGRPLPYVIFGPPGTGKTSTLVELVIQVNKLFPESRILVTTPSNSAADLLSERLIKFGMYNPGQFLRLVAYYRVKEGLIPDSLIPYCAFYSYSEGDSNFQTHIRRLNSLQITTKYRIIISTCCNIGALHYAGLPRGHFTHVIIDESGQTTEPELLIATTFQDIQTGQVILAGDPRQLGPTVTSALANGFGLSVSLLERFTSVFPYNRDMDKFPNSSGYNPLFITKFQINYRSVPEIIKLSNDMFYNSDLIPTVSQTEGPEAEIIKLFNFKAEGRETPAAIVFHGIVGQNYQEFDSPSWFNPHEVWQVIFYMNQLYSLGLKPRDVGIVTPYSKQAKKIIELMTELDMNLPKIGSVEEFQGQERNVIIVSAVRSVRELVKDDVAHCLGFVASPNRLNVALTRARALLIIIGNPFLLSADPYWLKVVEYCITNNSYTGCEFSKSSISENPFDFSDDSDEFATDENNSTEVSL